MKSIGYRFSGLLTDMIRRYLGGPEQQWIFEPPPQSWKPPRLERTSLYLHFPFCRHFCPYCPYTKVPYEMTLVESYTRAALIEVDWWADRIGPAEVTSVYIGGGTPTLALSSITTVLKRIRDRFRLTGEICIETNPSDVNHITVQQMHQANISLVSLGVQSFNPEHLKMIGRQYEPSVAEHALAMLAENGFLSINVDMMFALPNQRTSSLIQGMDRAAELGANQITTYPLFTFPYTSVGKYLKLTSVKMPSLRIRRAHYQAINKWSALHGFERVSVWGFKRGSAPRYSSVTRNGYIGIGPGAGSHIPDGFMFNTFNLDSWINATRKKRMTVALRMPFKGEISGWWWLYWRLYDTRIPMDDLDATLGKDAAKARQWLSAFERIGFAVHKNGYLELTELGSFWLHLAQNYFALRYVNTLWTEARQEPWPEVVVI